MTLNSLQINLNNRLVDLSTPVVMGIVNVTPDSFFIGNRFVTEKAILQAVEDEDAKGLQMAAHSLKSSSAYVGAMRLSDMSKELEMMGRANVMDGAKEKAERLSAEYVRVRTSLDAEIKLAIESGK